MPNFDGMGNHDQWYDFVGGAGKIQIGVSYQPNYGQSLTIEEFELMTVIGKGSFGKVNLSRKHFMFIVLTHNLRRCFKSANVILLVSMPLKQSEKRI